MLTLPTISYEVGLHCGRNKAGKASGSKAGSRSAGGGDGFIPQDKPNVLTPVEDAYSPEGMKERQRRAKIDDIADNLESGLFAIKPGDSSREMMGKNTAIEALREAKDPRIGLIRANNERGEPVGFMSYRVRNRNIEIMHVGTDQSRAGAGRYMFNKVLQEAKAKGKGLIVSAEADAAGFYSRMGMRRISSADDFELSAADVARR